MDEQIISDQALETRKGSSLLLVPEDIMLPDDCDLKVYDWSWESIAQIFSEMEFPVILKIDANYAELIYRIASYREVSLKTLYGLIGDYPSFWSISFSAYPRIDFQEYQLAKQDSSAHGGDSVPRSKKPEAEMKGLDPRVSDKIAKMSEEWHNAESESE